MDNSLAEQGNHVFADLVRAAREGQVEVAPGRTAIMAEHWSVPIFDFGMLLDRPTSKSIPDEKFRTLVDASQDALATSALQLPYTRCCYIWRRGAVCLVVILNPEEAGIRFSFYVRNAANSWTMITADGFIEARGLRKISLSVRPETSRVI